MGINDKNKIEAIKLGFTEGLSKIESNICQTYMRMIDFNKLDTPNKQSLIFPMVRRILSSILFDGYNQRDLFKDKPHFMGVVMEHYDTDDVIKMIDNLAHLTEDLVAGSGIDIQAEGCQMLCELYVDDLIKKIGHDKK